MDGKFRKCHIDPNNIGIQENICLINAKAICLSTRSQRRPKASRLIFPGINRPWYAMCFEIMSKIGRANLARSRSRNRGSTSNLTLKLSIIHLIGTAQQHGSSSSPNSRSSSKTAISSPPFRNGQHRCCSSLKKMTDFASVSATKN